MVTSRHQYTIMAGYGCLLVLVVAFQVVTSQEFQQGPPRGPPPGWAGQKCAGPPPGVKNPQSCCPVKPLFTEEEMAGCGFQKIEDGSRQGPPKPPDCSKQECLLKLKGCLNDDNTVNKKAVEDYINAWVAENEDFKPAVEAAKGFCLGENGIPGPPQICEANRLMFCFGGVIFTECPENVWQDTDDCKRLKEHMDECRGPPPN